MIRQRESKAIDNIKRETRHFFQCVQRMNPKESVGPLKVGESITNEPADMAKMMQEYFLTVYPTPSEEEKITDLQKYCFTDIPEGSLTKIDISPDAIEKVIKEMPGSSTPGDDGVGSAILKKSKDGLIVPLTAMFLNSLENNKPLESPYVSTIIPVLKPKKNRKEVSSYRPIALTSPIVKILKRNIIKNVVTHLKKQGIDDKCQFGFVK